LAQAIWLEADLAVLSAHFVSAAATPEEEQSNER